MCSFLDLCDMIEKAAAHLIGCACTAEEYVMDSRRHKRKVGYTIMIVSDSVEKNPKKFHINTGLLSIVAFVLLVAVICYAEYNIILMHGATERSEVYAGQIAELQKENEKLLSEKEELEKQIANLNQNLSQKEVQVQKQEETLQAAAEEENMPRGFPVNGAAQIKEADGADATGMQAREDWKEIIFTAAPGTNVIATGPGTVAGVVPAGDEPAGISIDHGNGYVSNYRNIGPPQVAAGSTVEQGTVLFEIEENNVEIGYSISKDSSFLEPMDIIEIKG